MAAANQGLHCRYLGVPEILLVVIPFDSIDVCLPLWYRGLRTSARKFSQSSREEALGYRHFSVEIRLQQVSFDRQSNTLTF